MRYLCICCVVLFPTVVFADRLTPRALDPVSAHTLAHAVERSAIARRLVSRLESSNVIVHIVSSAYMPDGLGGTTRFVTSRAVSATCGSRSAPRCRSGAQRHPRARAATAWEVARSDRHGAELKRLFEGEGRRDGE